MIPKVIHYCWFGGNPLPDSAKKYICSWKKYFPDYEIKEWNESNFDLHCCDYVREAYEAKKWAFVSDYARFWILYCYGGLYFDTDVEVIKPMDNLIKKGSFMGCETNLMTSTALEAKKMLPIEDSNIGFGNSLGLAAAPGLGLAAAPGLGLYKEILDYYNQIHFQQNDDGTYDTVVDHTTKVLRRHGFKGNGSIEKVEDIYIYPPEYFCPMNYRTGKLDITENTYTIHWYSASWQSGYSKLKTKMQHLLGEQITNWIIQIKRKVKE